VPIGCQDVNEHVSGSAGDLISIFDLSYSDLMRDGSENSGIETIE